MFTQSFLYYQTFNVFEEWREEFAQEFVQDHIPKLNSFYRKYFEWVMNAIPFYSDYALNIQHGITAFNVKAPRGFRDRFKTFLSDYSLYDYSDLLMIYLIDIKERNDFIVSEVSTEEGIKRLKDYFDDLKTFEKFQRRMASPKYKLLQVRVVFDQGENLFFKHPMIIGNLILNKGVFNSIADNVVDIPERSYKFQIYHKNKQEINTKYLMAVTKALYDFLKNETGYFQSGGTLKSDDLRLINDFLTLAEMPIYDIDGDPLDREVDRIRILYNWIKNVSP